MTAAADGGGFAGIGFIGFGEAAGAFLAGWAPTDPSVLSAFDVKTDDPAAAAGMWSRYRSAGIAGAARAGDALAGRTVVFSLVTADRALEAAEASAPGLARGALWLDCNSCSPETKRRAAELIEAAGARYVDVAVMAPVHPKRHRVPLLVAGPHAAAAIERLVALDMRPEPAGPAVGDASTVKMLRSVMVKGMEALTAECLLAAERAGVREAVLRSLRASNPGRDWEREGAYNLERMIVHGVRRAAEMREVAATLLDLGMPNRMAEATAVWQDAIGRLGLPGGTDDLGDRATRVLSAS
jgi:3-hydroxyisobutyrate dehydrogenase-like beta-hydroxyacid dehydrogenase